MFGITDGFDIAIGNPPYVESRNSLLSDEQKIAYGKQVVSDWKDALPRGSDLLIYFLRSLCQIFESNRQWMLYYTKRLAQYRLWIQVPTILNQQIFLLENY